MRHTLAAARPMVLFLVALIAAADSQLLAQGGPATPPAKPSPKNAKTSEVLKTSEVSAQPLTGIVVDPAGVPAADCKVWMVRGGTPLEQRAAEVIGQTATDSQGRFGFEKPGASCLARDARGRIGWPIRLPSKPGVKPEPGVRVQLFNVQDYRGRLLDAAGQPIAKAQVRPFYATTADIRKSRVTPDFGFFPAELLKEMGGETGPDGSFVLRGVPARGSLTATITAGGFGSVSVSCVLDAPVTIDLGRAGSIKGSVACAEEPAAVAGIKVRIWRRTPSPEQRDKGFVIHFQREIESGRDGSLSLAEVPPGTYAMMLVLDGKLAFCADLPDALEVKPGQAAAFSLPLHRAPLVRGKVVDAQTGSGLKDVDVLVSRSGRDDRQAFHAIVHTDAEGGFQVYAPPGTISQQVALRIPDGYLRPSVAGGLVSAYVTKDTTLPPIRLERAEALEGVVVDEAGKPVAGAEVIPFSGELRPRNLPGSDDRGKSDAAGKFSLRNITTKGPIQFRARMNTAVTDGPVTLQPGKDPIRLVVSTKNAFTLRGSLSDEAGRPVRGVTVRLLALWEHARDMVQVTVATATSDAQGRFEFPALWPGDPYQVIVAADGYDGFQSHDVVGEPGKTREFPKIVLVATGARSRGWSSTRPASPWPTCGSSTAATPRRPSAHGPTPRGDSASKGCGPARSTSSRRSRITDSRVCEQRRARPDSSSSSCAKTSRCRPQRGDPNHLTRRSESWHTSSSNDSGQPAMLGPCRAQFFFMARTDFPLAQKWSAEAGGRYDAQLRLAMIGHIDELANRNLDEALSLLAQVAPRSLYAWRRLTERYLTSDPAKAMRCAEEMAFRGRAMDQPARAVYLGQAGSLVMRLGKKDAGRELIDEAAGMAASLGSRGRPFTARGAVAMEIAPGDLKRALALLEPIEDRDEREAQLCDVALVASEVDLPKALELLRGIKGPHANRARVRIAHRLARTRPDEALKIVDSIRGDFAMYYRAEAFGWAAVSIAPRDKALACSLIDRGLAELLNMSRSSVSSQPRTLLAAFLAVQARRIGYPDMESVVFRVLATRPGTKESLSRSAGSFMAVAAVLALADPEAAKEMLRAAESRPDWTGPGGGLMAERHGLIAWSLANLKRAEELFDREYGKRTGDPKSDFRGCMDIAEALATPPAKRLQHIVQPPFLVADEED